MTWKKVKGFPDYEVSTLGEIRSVSRTSPYLRHKENTYTRKRGECILVPVKSSTGYYQVALYKEWRQYTKLVHRIVAETFIKNPENKPQVSHKNCDRLDNRLENLEWATVSENVQNGYRVLPYKKHLLGKYGKDSPCAKAVVMCSIDGKKIKSFPSIRDAGKDGFNETCISKCCTGKQKTHNGYRWVYKEVDKEKPRTVIQVL